MTLDEFKKHKFISHEPVLYRGIICRILMVDFVKERVQIADANAKMWVDYYEIDFRVKLD